jgi:hypothetical protein
MAKTLGFYRDGIRALREAGFDFASASNGYKLSGDLSSGQKSAIARALSRVESERDEPEESEERDETPWYDGGIESGDFDDIDWFDYDVLDDFTDEESDSYEEGETK